jgi:hypothetical protein
MPQAIDEDRFRQKPGQDGEGVLVSMDLHKPPVKNIPHAEFPRVVYKHPKEPFSTIEHRNAKHEVVHEEVVPNEHLTLVVNDKSGLKEALENGWVKEPYIPQAPPSKKASIY